jgi:hypothetical protein
MLHVAVLPGMRWSLVAAALVVIGCSDALTRDDAGLPSGASGAAGGLGGDGRASNCQAGGTGGAVSIRTCVGEAVGCDVDVGMYLPPQGSCTIENTACRGHACVNSNKIDEWDYDWASLCCDGQWLTLWPEALSSLTTPPACPKPLAPGDRFRCGDAGLTCVAGQSACVERVDQRTSSSQFACVPLCEAGDCSCFCPSAEGCTFNCQQSGACPLDPPDQACPLDRCSCGVGFDAVGAIHQPGTVQLTCTTEAKPQVGCTAGDDCLCAAAAPRSFAYNCSGSGPPDADCIMAPLTSIGPACGVDSEVFCCAR